MVTPDGDESDLPYEVCLASTKRMSEEEMKALKETVKCVFTDTWTKENKTVNRFRIEKL